MRLVPLDQGRSLDKLSLGGTSGITMDPNPTGSFSLMKATLLR
jgi:hypothetical protein